MSETYEDLDGKIDEVLGDFVIDMTLGRDVRMEVDFGTSASIKNVRLYNEQGEEVGDYDSATDLSLQVYQALFGDLPVSK